MTKRAALLKNTDAQEVYKVHIRLQQNQWCEFCYSDRTMAREHFDLLRTIGVIGSLAIKEIQFHEPA